MSGRIDSIWTGTLKRKASEILTNKIKPIVSGIGLVELERYLIFEYQESQLLLKFNFYDFAQNYKLIWKHDDPISYEKMIDGGIKGEYKKYFDDYAAFVDSGELVFLIEHKLMITLLFQKLGKCVVKHQIVSDRPLSKRRLAGTYHQLHEVFSKLEKENCLVDWEKSSWSVKDSDLLYLKSSQDVISLLFFLSTVDNVMESEKLNEVVQFIIDMNIQVRELIRKKEMKLKDLLLSKNYHGYSAVSQLFRRIMLVYDRLFEMIGKSEWILE